MPVRKYAWSMQRVGKVRGEKTGGPTRLRHVAANTVILKHLKRELWK